MVKCPNCGLTAQINLDNHEIYVWKDILSIYLTYKCECGCNFTTRVEVDRSNEKIL